MQLTLNFDAGLVQSYASCREYVAARVHQQQRQQKAIAADMDYSPSDLSRKLAQSPDDSRRFTLDDLEKYITVTGDTHPVLYLVEKYLADAGDEIAALERRLEQLRAGKK
ncbi:hypothetical protein M2D07_006525 [Pseudomonas sp. BGr12]|uniref:XRE family transcriptional regulator n=1 Tax=Pseudomonas nitroreducens TaxID=46680 RepID=A0A5R8ZQ77_PSENT|nr:MULTISPECIES: hypothetical protein [Pseudomonas]MDL2426669.1 hypothetical protein [Pseudomonas sp. BJa5]TLP68214.1 hypothetical protein FEA48_30645 [Pseudomonas nitroreducens]